MTNKTLMSGQTENFTTTCFSVGKEELLKLSPDGFFYKGERVDDIHDVYNRFNEWLTAAKRNNQLRRPMPESWHWKNTENKMTDEREPIDNIFADVAIERLSQDKKWGGPKHDDKHSARDFVMFIQEKSNIAATKAYYADWDDVRKRLIQVAALAVAAVESLDRKYGE